MPSPKELRWRVEDTTPGPWMDWTGLTRAERAVKFIQTYCRSPKGVGWGKPLVLSTWQVAWIENALADGITTAVMSLPRGQGKSTLAAALAVWAVFDTDEAVGSPVVPVVATTVGQAVRSVFGVAVAMVNAEPELSNRCLIYSGITNPRIFVPSNGGSCFPMSSEPAGAQGLDITLAIVDEIGFLNLDSFTAFQMAGGKRTRSLVMALGTPGLDRENALFHIRKMVKEGAVLPGLLYREFAAPPNANVRDETVWRKCNPAIDAGYLSIDSLRADVALMPESHFRIFRLGEHEVEGTDNWLGADGQSVWDALEDSFAFTDAPTWVGVDIGLKRDSTAVVAVQFRPDGRLHAKCKIWLPTKYEPVDVTDVMAYVRSLSNKHKVEAISYDPRFFDVPAKMLSDEGLPLVEVPQSVEHMTPAIGNLYVLIQTAGITHDRDDAFKTQILNAIPRVNERGFTLAKGKSRGRIDAAIALALAVDRAQHRTKPRSGAVVL